MGVSSLGGGLEAKNILFRARSVGSIILGDKEKPEVTRHLNDRLGPALGGMGCDIWRFRGLLGP